MTSDVDTTYLELRQIECRVFHTTPTPIVAHSQQSIFETVNVAKPNENSGGKNGRENNRPTDDYL